ncbi:MAG TPA: hypothetical protein VEA80_14550 [Vitreimonas sp.]|uniref:hypothetical protein n=1 Tax=Vitreimonas sp. TaxID=3069702 RepID=UPI002D7461DF|nr:hypothetical protein [Vitreimonas sp.]HYD88691.1 hypothetical protein [Vitreimonas sp.]
MKRPAYAAAAAAVFLAACGASQFPQFGQSAYRLEGLTTPPEGGPATHTIIYRDGPKMRVEATLPAIGRATIVFDDASRGAYVLNPGAQQTGVAASAIGVPPPPPPVTVSFAPADAATPAPPPGVAVRIDDADAPQPLETAWAALGPKNTRTEGLCEVAGERGRLWRPRTAVAGVERVACITRDGIVLKVTENDLVLWEATSLQRGPQDPSLFGVPAGYRMVDPQTIASAEERRVVGAPPPLEEAPPPRG